jgi:Ca2+-binding RTX toxin-like protein
VYASVSYSLTGANTNGVDQLILVGSDNINATGNDKGIYIEGNEGNNMLRGGLGVDYIYGMLGNDYLEGGSGDNTLDGGEGDDSLYAGIGNDVLIGGDGNDQLLADSGAGDENPQGGADFVFGGAGDDFIEDGGGADFVDAGSGNDTLGVYYWGANTIIGGAGGDYYRIDDRDDNDVIVESSADNLDDDSVIGSAGRDTLDIHTDRLIDLDQAPQGSDYSGIEDVWLRSRSVVSPSIYEMYDINVTLLGNALSNELHTGSGNDLLDGRLGDDRLYASLGNDTLIGGGGEDYLYGEEGDDLLEVTGAGFHFMGGGSGSDTLLGSEESDWLDGGTGADLMVGGDGFDEYFIDSPFDLVEEQVNQGIDTVHLDVEWAADGSIFTFNLTGTNIENVAMEGSYDMDAYGSAESNTLMGNAGINFLSGNGGDDFLQGGGGGHTEAGTEVYLRDWFQGGAGNDTYLIGEDGGSIMSGAVGSSADWGQDHVQFSGDPVHLELNFYSMNIFSLWFSQQDNDLVISRLGSNSSLTLDGWFNADAGPRDLLIHATPGIGERFLNESGVNTLVAAMSTLTKPTVAGTVRTNSTDPALAALAQTEISTSFTTAPSWL